MLWIPAMKLHLRAPFLTQLPLPVCMTVVAVLLLLHFQVSHVLLGRSVPGYHQYCVCLLKCILIMLGALVLVSPSEESDETPSEKMVLIIILSFIVVLVIALCGAVLCVAILCFIWKSRSTTGAGWYLH